MKIRHLQTGLLAGLLLPFVLSAEWELVDDMESGPDKWVIDNRLDRPPEEGTFDSSWGIVPRPFDDQGGQALSVSEGSVLWQVLDVGIDLGTLPQANTFTLYYEISQSDLSADRAMGLHPETPDFWWTANEDGTYTANFSWGQYATAHRMGRVNLNVRSADGTSYADPYSDNQQAEAWYKFWMVVNPTEFKWDLYTQGGEFDEITRVTSEIEGGYTWRNLTFDPLRTWRLRIGGNTTDLSSTGALTYLDNFYLDTTGMNLEQPPVSGGGEVVTWNGYEVLDDGWANTGTWMGWVNVNDDPWILSASLDGWIFMPEGQDTTAGGWLYVFK